jgi:hypothetical protein
VRGRGARIEEGGGREIVGKKEERRGCEKLFLYY